MSRKRGPASQDEGVRLQKVLARAGIGSRRGSEELITAGRVRVNGRLVTELGTRVDPARDRISVDGKPVTLEEPVYFLMNKPDAVVSSAVGPVDERGRPTVLSLMRGVRQRVYPVGRLDFHTRGLLILTNDGDFSAALTHPRHKVPKTYHAKFQGRLSDEDMDRLKHGVTLEDGTVTLPLPELLALRDTETTTWVQMTLTQGLYRQIRRMGEAIGHPVLKLLRVAIGDVTTDGLAEGEYRPLTLAEVEQLRALSQAAAPRPSRR